MAYTYSKGIECKSASCLLEGAIKAYQPAELGKSLCSRHCCLAKGIESFGSIFSVLPDIWEMAADV